MRQVDVTGIKFVETKVHEKWVQLKAVDVRGDITTGSIFLHPSAAKRVGQGLIEAANGTSAPMLTKKQVNQIKKLLDEGEAPIDIANKFNVKVCRIYDVRRKDRSTKGV